METSETKKDFSFLIKIEIQTGITRTKQTKEKSQPLVESLRKK
jgi:hypothetical protein